MNKFQHLLWGSLFFIIGYVLIADVYPIKGMTFFLSFAICLTYAVIPDLDLSNSWIKKKLDIIVFILIIFLAIFFFIVNRKFIIPIAILLIVEVVLLFMKHRTILHSPITGIFLALPLYFLDPIYFAAAYVGFISHWAMDNVKLK